MWVELKWKESAEGKTCKNMMECYKKYIFRLKDWGGGLLLNVFSWVGFEVHNIDICKIQLILIRTELA